MEQAMLYPLFSGPFVPRRDGPDGARNRGQPGAPRQARRPLALWAHVRRAGVSTARAAQGRPRGRTHAGNAQWGSDGAQGTGAVRRRRLEASARDKRRRAIVSGSHTSCSGKAMRAIRVGELGALFWDRGEACPVCFASRTVTGESGQRRAARASWHRSRLADLSGGALGGVVRVPGVAGGGCAWTLGLLWASGPGVSPGTRRPPSPASARRLPDTTTLRQGAVTHSE